MALAHKVRRWPRPKTVYVVVGRKTVPVLDLVAHSTRETTLGYAEIFRSAERAAEAMATLKAKGYIMSMYKLHGRFSID